MGTESFFLLAAKICGILAGILGLVTVVAWWRQWPFRFAFFGYTAFMTVLTAGCFALTLTPIIRPPVAGSAPYHTVYDRGANQAVIKVETDISPETLELTLQQAAQKLASSGRFSTGSRLFTLRARTVIHPEPGISVPLYLGQLQQDLGTRQDPDRTIEIFPDAFRQLEAVQG